MIHAKQLHLQDTMQAGKEDEQDELDKFNYNVGLEYDWSVSMVHVC
jgi:hypothetical protein